MKLLLIAPKDSLPGPGLGWWNQEYLSLVKGKSVYGLARLNLPTLAGLTPDGVEVKIVDENVEEIDYDEDVDAVGISFYTYNAPRAYDIAARFRKKKRAVVLGGLHASALPDEAAAHADSIVIGEAEDIWPRVVRDIADGKLRRRYSAAARPSLDGKPPPRWDLMRHDRYSTPGIQTTRGCPYDCEFCSVKAFLGSAFRCKPVDRVLREVDNLTRLGFRLLFFTDDNFVGNRRYSTELLQALIPLGISYQTQMPINIARDEELLSMLAESGCKRTIVGLESLSNDNLRDVNKHASCRAETYAAAIEKIQSYGIEVFGSFILGCDYDDEGVFERTARFVKESSLSMAAFNILTPFPGTRLFRRLTDEKRIAHHDWSRYDGMHVCFTPKRMDADTLQKGFYWIHREVYSYEAIFERLKNIWRLWNTTNVRHWDRISPILMNLNYNNVAYSYPAAPGQGGPGAE